MSIRSNLRGVLHREQGGVCYWEQHGKCRMQGVPLDLDEPYRIKGVGKNPKHASFEHLTPVRDGGEFNAEKIRLVHAKCNLDARSQITLCSERNEMSNTDQSCDAKADTRTCTCYPDGRPEPCERRFAFHHCWRAAAQKETQALIVALKNRDRNTYEQLMLDYAMRVRTALEV